jgi:hypothetical protein
LHIRGVMTESQDHATHVLIRGHVFLYAEKAPFVASGVSAMGAIEFNQADDTCRCHECGGYIRGLGNHIRRHGLKRRDYNLRHGLRRNTRLGPPSIAAKHRKCVGQNNHKAIHLANAATKLKRGTMPTFGHSHETLNLNARCRAQLFFRVQMLALKIGHTPTKGDMRAAGISASSIRRQFGGIPELAAIAGLQENRSGQKVPSPLPRDYPNEQQIRDKFNERMPWPDDYAALQPFNRRA